MEHNYFAYCGNGLITVSCLFYGDRALPLQIHLEDVTQLNEFTAGKVGITDVAPAYVPRALLCSEMLIEEIIFSQCSLKRGTNKKALVRFESQLYSSTVECRVTSYDYSMSRGT